MMARVGEGIGLVLVDIAAEIKRGIRELIPAEVTVDVAAVVAAAVGTGVGMALPVLDSAISLVSSACCSAMVFRKSASLVSMDCCCESSLELMVVNWSVKWWRTAAIASSVHCCWARMASSRSLEIGGGWV
jgi:hypothetical protein